MSVHSGDVRHAARRASPASSSRRNARRHAPLTLLLHWATAVLLALAAAAIVLRDYAEGGGLRALLLVAHESCGIAVLALTLARLVWRIRGRVGAVHADQPRALHWSARAGHYTIYAVLLALPLLGWLAVDAHGRELLFLGVLRLPQLLARNRVLADALEQWHLWTAWGLLVLVAGHVAFALAHHLVRRDAVLSSMLPLLKRPRQPVVSRLQTILDQRRRIALALANGGADQRQARLRPRATGTGPARTC